MKYVSTRGRTDPVPFKDAVIMGLATDGGLLVPQFIPDVGNKLNRWSSLAYGELAFEIIRLFADDIPENDLRRLINASYSTFADSRVTPIKKAGDLYILELFHGPTLSFKDVALQLLGNLFEYILAERDQSLNILGATSGDTGSAAIAGVRGRKNIDIFIMFPEGKTSPIQERQMTSVLDANIHNLGIDGSFDDCQYLLKSIFSDLEFKEKYQLGAVNSVNWARVLAQIVYYFSSWYQLDMPARFDVCVPTGNFGNIFAAYLARRMGLPINRLILATNANDVLSVFFNTGRYARGDVRFSHSPAMDIQVASNFERYMYFRFGESGEKVREFMDAFNKSGKAQIHLNTPEVDVLFRASSATDAETVECIRTTFNSFGYLADPHTAVGLHVAGKYIQKDIPMLCMATAHPAKFPEVVQQALPDTWIGHESLDLLKDMPTRKENLRADIDAVKNFIISHQRISD
ncbi:MAG: threonine synthase [Gammaproteobacteria bacterium]|nr:threonine synthase [Gammaproteobacteria bacterium]